MEIDRTKYSLVNLLRSITIGQAQELLRLHLFNGKLLGAELVLCYNDLKEQEVSSLKWLTHLVTYQLPFLSIYLYHWLCNKHEQTQQNQNKITQKMTIRGISNK